MSRSASVLWSLISVIVPALGIPLFYYHRQFTLEVQHSAELLHKVVECNDRWYRPNEERPDERPYMTFYPR